MEGWLRKETETRGSSQSLFILSFSSGLPVYKRMLLSKPRRLPGTRGEEAPARTSRTEKMLF